MRAFTIIKYIFDNVLCNKSLVHKALSNIYLIIVDEYNIKHRVVGKEKKKHVDVLMRLKIL